MADEGDYGYTVDGVKITNELIERYSAEAEAEAGYDLGEWTPAKRSPQFVPGEPITLRLDARFRYLLELRAAHERRPPEAIVSDALIEYLIRQSRTAGHEGDTGR